METEKYLVYVFEEVATIGDQRHRLKVLFRPL